MSRFVLISPDRDTGDPCFYRGNGTWAMPTYYPRFACEVIERCLGNHEVSPVISISKDIHMAAPRPKLDAIYVVSEADAHALVVIINTLGESGSKMCETIMNFVKETSPILGAENAA